MPTLGSDCKAQLWGQHLGAQTSSTRGLSSGVSETAGWHHLLHATGLGQGTWSPCATVS